MERLGQETNFRYIGAKLCSKKLIHCFSLLQNSGGSGWVERLAARPIAGLMASVLWHGGCFSGVEEAFTPVAHAEHGMNLFIGLLLGLSELVVFMARFSLLSSIAFIQHLLQGGAW